MYTEAEFGETTQLAKSNSEIRKTLKQIQKYMGLALGRARKFANLWIKLQNVFPINTYMNFPK